MKSIFSIIVPLFFAFSAFAQPTNNDCVSATLLSYSGSCNYTTYSNVSATNSGDATASCGGTPDTDIWFKIVVPTSGNLAINTGNLGSSFYGAMALYSGDCNNLTQYICDDNSSTDYLMPYIEFQDTSIAGGYPVFTVLGKFKQFR